MLRPVTGQEMQAAQILTGAAMALFLMAGLVPGLKRHAGPLRVLVLVAYLLGCAALVGHALLN